MTPSAPRPPPAGTHGDAEAMLRHPPAPLPGYQLIEITITDASPAAGQALSDVAWPPASVPVSVLHARRLRTPDPGLTLAPGDRVSLLIPENPPPRHPAGESASPVADSVTLATGDPVKPELGPQQDPAREQS